MRATVGAARNAQLDHPKGLALSLDGDLYIADYDNARIRKIDPGGTISTVLGNGDCAGPIDGSIGNTGDGGPATEAQIGWPGCIEEDKTGRLWDRDVGLVRFGARDYDPETGRWTAKDRILFHA